MTVTLEDLAAQVNDELENGPKYGHADAVGDGFAMSFGIAPINRTILNDGSLHVYVDNVEDTGGSMNYANGVYTFAVAPLPDASITADFNHVYWTQSIVEAAVNQGVNALFPAFYVSVVETQVTDGEAYEYTLTTPNVAAVCEVSISTTSEPPWRAQSSRNRSYYLVGEAMVLRFYSPPASGSMRVISACRPALLLDATSALDVADRAAIPIVSYAAYALLNQKMPVRVRSDVSANVTGQGSLSPRQMNDAANAYMLRFQTQLATAKMFPWRIY